MDNLETLIQTAVGQEYSCIQEGDVVMPPCYLITPYGIGGLRGNGSCVNPTVQYEICFFVESRLKAVKIASELQNMFLKNKYACANPQIEHEKNAKAWKVMFLVEGIMERNEKE